LRDARGRLRDRRSGGLDRLHLRQARDIAVELVAEREAGRVWVVVDAQRHRDVPVDLRVEIEHLVGAQGLVGDRCQQQRGGAGVLRILGQLQHVLRAHGTDAHHDRRPLGRVDGQPRDTRALLALQVRVVARAPQRADRVHARLGEPRDQADERRFVDAALVHRREREGAQSREHQPERSG
jgi:hypothetical protein